MLGKLLSLPVRLVNAPLKAVEKGLDALLDPGGAGLNKDDGVISKPLDFLAEALEEIDE